MCMESSHCISFARITAKSLGVGSIKRTFWGFWCERLRCREFIGTFDLSSRSVSSSWGVRSERSIHANQEDRRRCCACHSAALYREGACGRCETATGSHRSHAQNRILSTDATYSFAHQTEFGKG